MTPENTEIEGIIQLAQNLIYERKIPDSREEDTAIKERDVEMWRQLINILEKSLSGILTKNGIIFSHTSRPTTSEFGVALSPINAGDCIKDTIRTAQFMLGVDTAMQSVIARKRAQNQEANVKILYAGCGPYAPLVLPLIPRYSDQNIEIHLLDIHLESIEAVQALCLKLDFFPQYNIHFHCKDATKIDLKKEQCPDFDIVLSETMDAGLRSEPQAAILYNVAKQVKEDCIFLPESIQLSVAVKSLNEYLSTLRRIHTINPEYFNFRETADKLRTWHILMNGGEGSQFSSKNESRGDYIIRELTLRDAKNIEKSLEDFLRTVARLEIPASLDETQLIILETRINVFKNISIDPGDSHITRPLLIGLTNRQELTNLAINYILGRN